MLRAAVATKFKNCGTQVPADTFFLLAISSKKINSLRVFNWLSTCRERNIRWKHVGRKPVGLRPGNYEKKSYKASCSELISKYVSRENEKNKSAFHCLEAKVKHRSSKSKTYTLIPGAMHVPTKMTSRLKDPRRKTPLDERKRFGWALIAQRLIVSGARGVKKQLPEADRSLRDK